MTFDEHLGWRFTSSSYACKVVSLFTLKLVVIVQRFLKQVVFSQEKIPLLKKNLRISFFWKIRGFPERKNTTF